MNQQSDIKATVLFLDDEPAILEGIRHGLRRYPFVILTANTVEQALALLAVHPVEIVVSDERMPGIQGSEFLALVCGKYPETIRIILSGQSTLDSAIRAVNEGEIFRFLLKPCNPADLAQTLHMASQFRALRRQTARLLAETRQRGQLIRDVERAHPGITEVKRSDSGVIEVDVDSVTDLETLLKEVEQELSRTTDPEDGTRRAA